MATFNLQSFLDQHRVKAGDQSISDVPESLPLLQAANADDLLLPYPENEAEAGSSCNDVIEDHLLEGALRNLSYFPQLLKEVNHIKQEKQKKLAEEKQRQRVQLLEEERARTQAAIERQQELEKKKEQNILDAKALLAEHDVEKLESKLSDLRNENSLLRRQSMFNKDLHYVLAHHAEIQRDMITKVFLQCQDNSQFTEADNNPSLRSSTDLEKVLGINLRDIVTFDCQVEIRKLKQRQQELEAGIAELRMRTTQKRAEKKRLIGEKLALCSSDNQLTREDLIDSIESFKNQKANLEKQLASYKTTE